jgi:two-component system response regulator ChvI
MHAHDNEQIANSPDVTATEKQRRQILVVDDDDSYREMLARNLRNVSFAVEGFDDGQQALDRVRNGIAPNLILLDWKMSDMNGVDVLHHLHEVRSRTPVLILTAHSDQIYEEAALQMGALDFIPKHRSFAILLRRIELVLSGAKASASTVGHQPARQSLCLGPLELHFDVNRALWKGRRVDLSLTEFHVVHRLAASPGLDVSYREIHNLVRGEGFLAKQGAEGYRVNARSTMKRIRQKFRMVDGDCHPIETYTGFGYSWRDQEAVSTHYRGLPIDEQSLRRNTADTAQPQGAQV